MLTCFSTFQIICASAQLEMQLYQRNEIIPIEDHVSLNHCIYAATRG